MKSRLSPLVAALAASAASLAFAQAAPQTTATPSAESPSTPAATPAWTPSKDPVPSTLTFVQEPVASSSRTAGADGELAKSIIDALTAEDSMKGSKITVQPENGSITLTGVVPSRAQVKRAGEIATQFAGEGKVVNAIQDSQS